MPLMLEIFGYGQLLIQALRLKYDSHGPSYPLG